MQAWSGWGSSSAGAVAPKRRAAIGWFALTGAGVTSAPVVFLSEALTIVERPRKKLR